MNIIFLLIPLAFLLGLGALVSFLYAVKKGQFSDLTTPAWRALIEEKEKKI